MVSNRLWNVRDYGAIGDGATKDTQALQKAIDSCAEAGGGAVTVPAGTYVSGTLYLRSHIELRLEAGATLLASPDRDDYNADDVFAENQVFTSENVTGAHLIIAYRQHNVSITGSGVIHGNGAHFFDPMPEGKIASYRFKTGNFTLRAWRPGQMIFICRCTHVSVRDVSLIDSTYWNLFLLGCNDVQVRGLTIDNPAATQNGDGIDIDCSRNVTVSDCIIRSGDDCITLRANRKPLGEDARCEHVTVTNCVLSSPTCAFRIGVGDGEIRHCSVSNIVIAEARTAVNMVMRYSESSRHGSRIEQVHFSDIVADVAMPFVVCTGTGAIPPAYIRDVSFSRFRVTASAGSQLAGTAEVPLVNIRISELDLLIRGGTDNLDLADKQPPELSKFGYHGNAGLPALPCAIYGAYLQNAAFDRVRVRWESLGAVWKDGMLLKHSDDVELRDVSLRQPRTDEGAAIRLHNCGDVTLRDSRAPKGTNTFIQVEQARESVLLRCIANDWTDAERPIDADATVTVWGHGCLTRAGNGIK
ncbi:MAG: glycoside hydrolase family 28 [Paenibacillus sp.]|jgi:hypothetical protein|nr:glycoside hydrolase family 28 [Paenibacillus sp.]